MRPDRPNLRMKVLVTGVAGFIGYHLAARLLGEGATVTGLDNLSAYYDVGLKRARLDDLKSRFGFEAEIIDIADHARLEKLCASAAARNCRASRRPGRRALQHHQSAILCRQQPRRLRQPARGLPPACAAASALRFVELRIRSKPPPAAARGRCRDPPDLALCRDQARQ